LKKDR